MITKWVYNSFNNVECRTLNDRYLLIGSNDDIEDSLDNIVDNLDVVAPGVDVQLSVSSDNYVA